MATIIVNPANIPELTGTLYSKYFNFLSSTDSQLKLWDVSKQQCLRTFKGHLNEKNFVGLAASGDYVACGMLAFHSLSIIL